MSDTKSRDQLIAEWDERDNRNAENRETIRKHREGVHPMTTKHPLIQHEIKREAKLRGEHAELAEALRNIFYAVETGYKPIRKVRMTEALTTARALLARIEGGE